MGIYIKGMEMPESCHDCEIGGAKQLDKAGNCPFYRLEWWEQEEYRDHRVDGCPLVPVPAHGRLIDADEVIGHLFNGEQCLYSWDEIEESVDATSTIIPAEEGET